MSVSGETTIGLMQCDTSLSHRVDCGLLNVFYSYFLKIFLYVFFLTVFGVEEKKVLAVVVRSVVELVSCLSLKRETSSSECFTVFRLCLRTKSFSESSSVCDFGAKTSFRGDIRERISRLSVSFVSLFTLRVCFGPQRH